MALIASPFAGIVVGFLGAVGVGPLNIAVMNDGLRGKTRTAVAMILGGTVGDIFYCSLAMLGLSQFFRTTLQSLTFRLVFGIGIVAFGLVILVAGKVDLDRRSRPTRLAHLHNSFWIGLALTLLNPHLIFTWVFLASAVQTLGVVGEGIAENLLFAVGAGLGMAAWLNLLLYLLVRHRMRIPLIAIRWIVKGFGLALIVAGALCMFGIGLKE